MGIEVRRQDGAGRKCSLQCKKAGYRTEFEPGTRLGGCFVRMSQPRSGIEQVGMTENECEKNCGLN